MILVEIDKQPVDGARALAAVADPASGGQTLFVGTVRNHHQGKDVVKLSYEAYGAMAEKECRRIASEALERWPLQSVAILHATGELQIGDAAVAVAASAAHRTETFEAVAWIMNAIKLHVPIFKHEMYTDGSSAWVRCTHAHSDPDLQQHGHAH